MSVKVGGVEMFMGPRETGGPDDLKQAIVDFIDGSEERLDIAVQELDNWDIAKAIIAARQRGVRVRLVLELDYLRSKRPQVDPLAPGGSLRDNRDIHNALLRTAIKVNSDFNTNIFHQKFIIRDSKSLLTGSTNFTTTGTSTNLNHIVIVNDDRIARIYTREFREISQGHFGKLNEGHDKAPDDVDVSNLPIRILFAPDHNPEMEIMKQMAKARKRIDFAIFTFAESSGIDDQMIMMKKAGIPIRGALDGRQANQKWAATRPVKNAGAELFLVSAQNGLRKLHHKLMVIDKQVVIAGSFNYTGPANRLNDENIIIIGDLESTNQQSVKVQRKFAKFAFDEINRIIARFGKKI
jgi:phosphatidylserine/phosphatidylglycerophosphate/cardiolipin synthase-like enzyme